MASITIRQLDEEVKTGLRLRAARNGRSMEDEARSILRSASGAETGDLDAAPPRARESARAQEAPEKSLQRLSPTANGDAQARRASCSSSGAALRPINLSISYAGLRSAISRCVAS